MAASASERTATTPLAHARGHVIVNDDGFSSFFSGTYKSEADVRAHILSYRAAPVAVFEWCISGGSRVNYPSKATELIGAGLTEFPRRGDKLAYEVYAELAARGVNLTQVVADACHDAGFQCYASLRMNGDYAKSADGDLNQRQFNSAFWWAHPEMRVRDARGADKIKLSYAFPEVRAFKLAILREAAANGIDGVNLDFLRHPPFLGYEEPLLRAFEERYKEDARQVKADDPRWLQLRCEVMSEFVGSVRAMLDEMSAKPGRRMGLSARIDWREARGVGCDVERWIKSGWLDYVVVGQHSLGGYEIDLRPFVAMARGTRCAVYYGEEAILSGHDLTAKEDRLIKAGKMAPPKRDHLSPDDYAQRAAKWKEMGAAGVHLFNAQDLESINAAASAWEQ